MRYFIIIVSVAVLIGTECLLCAQDQNSQPEIKESKSVSNGKYKCVKETFLKKSLISRVTEIGVQGTKEPELVAVKLFDQGKMTYSSIFQKKEHTTIRSYFVDGKLAVQEGDEDGDGFFETLVVFEQGVPELAFHRKSDGTVIAFTKEEFIKLKRGFSLIEN